MTHPRVTTSWKLSGTKSFRLAASKVLNEYGTNLQNPDDALMRCVIPDEGKIFLQADQAGAEALIVAYEARPGRFRELFDYGIKPHTYLALHIFIDKFRGSQPRDRYWKRSAPELLALPEWPELNKLISKKSPTEYNLGKMTVHAKNYDMKGPTFQMYVLVRTNGKIVLSLAEANAYITMYSELFPEIIEQQIITRNTVLATRTLHNLFGHPRTFTGRWSAELEREAYSFVPQSTVGEITNRACCELQEYIEAEKLDWDFLNNKHDSFMQQVPRSRDHILAAARKMQELLNVPLTSTRGERYNMRSEVSIGLNWAKADEDNPFGMTELTDKNADELIERYLAA